MNDVVGVKCPQILSNWRQSFGGGVEQQQPGSIDLHSKELVRNRKADEYLLADPFAPKQVEPFGHGDGGFGVRPGVDDDQPGYPVRRRSTDYESAIRRQIGIRKEGQLAKRLGGNARGRRNIRNAC